MNNETLSAPIPHHSVASSSPSGEPLLVARDLHKTYSIGSRMLEVLRGVSLVVNRGEFLAVRGASGAGKSCCPSTSKNQLRHAAADQPRR